MTTISDKLQAVLARIADATRKSGCETGTTALLAVSKTWPASAVREAAAAGQRAFGENYVQEGVSKIEALADLELEWHFIGPLQGNKTRLVAENFAWVHSLDRLKIAERLSAQRPTHLPDPAPPKARRPVLRVGVTRLPEGAGVGTGAWRVPRTRRRSHRPCLVGIRRRSLLSGAGCLSAVTGVRASAGRCGPRALYDGRGAVPAAEVWARGAVGVINTAFGLWRRSGRNYPPPVPRPHPGECFVPACLTLSPLHPSGPVADATPATPAPPKGAGGVCR